MCSSDLWAVRKTPAVDRLAKTPTESTKHMTFEERQHGVVQMILDLHKLADRDGNVAAAWALEKLLTWPEENDGEG